MIQSVEEHLRDAAAALANGQLAQAHAQLEALVAAAPGDTRTRLLASRIALREDRIRDAARIALEAADRVPADPALLLATVETLLQTGEVVAARHCMAQPVLAQSRDPRWLLRLARLRQRLDENAEALPLIERAAATGANDPVSRFDYGVQLYFNGRLEEAERQLETGLCEQPTLGRAALALARLRKWTEDHNHVGLILAGLKRVAQGTRDHAALLFALYKELEDVGRDEYAWKVLAQGNAVMHARRPWDAGAHARYLDRLLAACDADRVAPQGAVNPGPQPIFILGMPRSGTTVLERMLGNHSRVAQAGELIDFGMQLHWAADTASTHSDAFISRIPDLDLAEVGQRYLAQTRWRARDKTFYIDKQPPNWVLAGLIHAALPGARILHLVRDPMDVCFSNWRAFFGDTYSYSYAMDTLTAYYRGYRRTLQHWHAVMPGAILDVPYAELVREPDATLRKVLDFCGLAWESGCSDITRNAAPSATLSAAQVRSPVHDRAFGEWRRYAMHLSGLESALADPEWHSSRNAASGPVPER